MGFVNYLRIILSSCSRRKWSWRLGSSSWLSKKTVLTALGGTLITCHLGREITLIIRWTSNLCSINILSHTGCVLSAMNSIRDNLPLDRGFRWVPPLEPCLILSKLETNWHSNWSNAIICTSFYRDWAALFILWYLLVSLGLVDHLTQQVGGLYLGLSHFLRGQSVLVKFQLSLVVSLRKVCCQLRLN